MGKPASHILREVVVIREKFQGGSVCRSANAAHVSLSREPVSTRDQHDLITEGFHFACQFIPIDQGGVPEGRGGVSG
jgi:hypothetical protein